MVDAIEGEPRRFVRSLPSFWRCSDERIEVATQLADGEPSDWAPRPPSAVAGGGFEQCYNAQAVVATESLLVIATDVVQTPNDKQQIAPMLEKIDALPERFGQVETLLADNGYFSEANVMVCVAPNVEPLIAAGRQPHHPSWRERFAAAPPTPENPTPVEMMAWRLRTPQGKERYGLRKQTPEPVFGIIKSVMGFRTIIEVDTRR
jgi:hypothetical protein